MSDEPSLIANLKDLAASVSTQAQVSNRMWFGLITVSIISLLPPSSAPEGIKLPFDLGTVDHNWFNRVMFALLIVLMIAFASAHAQQVRAQILAHDFIKRVSDKKIDENMHVLDLFDMFREPSINRVAPLAQALRFGHQFYRDGAGGNWFLRLVAVIYYSFLKAISISAYFGVPAIALVRTFLKIQWTQHFLTYATNVALTFTLLALAQVVITDIIYAFTVGKKIWTND